MSARTTSLASKSEEVLILDLFAAANQCSRSEVMRYALGFMLKHHPKPRLGAELRKELKLATLNYAHKKKIGDEQLADTST